tara:strand:+ start:12467 stop:13462 length:996 start_codon:yes stop_codon:yes gene_type:complete
LNNYSHRLIKRCLSAGILGLLIVVVGSIVVDRTFDFGVPVYGFILGFLTAIIEMYILRRVKNQNPTFIVGFRVVLYIANIALCLGLMRLTYFLVLPEENITDFSTKSFGLNLSQSIIISITILFYLQLEAIVGVGVFHNLLLGRYQHPKKEWRYFMFMDINNSTQLVESLGDDTYFSMLNAYLRDLSKPVFESGASIYKYMGDEIMLTWKDKKTFEPEIALKVYTDFKHIIESKSDFYMKSFGAVPTFKAGLHYGEVITAKVGDLKKEIAYNGDVLNITSRIMDRCKEFKQGIIMTEVVYNKMSEKPKNVLEISNLNIEGKRDPINVYGLK